MTYYTYILECSDKTYYCGYTNNLEKRIKDHNEGKIGAKYTKNRRPVTLKYFETFTTLSDVLKRENTIKKLTRKQKINLIKSNKQHTYTWGVGIDLIKNKNIVKRLWIKSQTK